MAEYRLSPAAEQDLENIWHYTNQQWGIEQAHRYIDTITVAFESLANAPQTAPSCDHIRAGYRRQYIEQHVIYFQVTAYGIAIVRVLHGRMDAVRHL